MWRGERGWMLKALVIFALWLWRGMPQLLPGVILCVVLAKGGDALAHALGIGVPGAALGLIVLAIWLAMARRTAWSRPGALLLARWIGAALVPVLVGLTAYVSLLAGVVGPLALLLVVTTVMTGVATALIYRWLAGVI